MPFMPSHAFVAKALHSVGADTEWEEAPQEEQRSHMQLAKVAIGAILSWQRSHKPDGTNRYTIEPTKDDDATGRNGYEIYDRIQGLSLPLGVVYDALLAQQIVENLNKRDTERPMPQMPKGPVYGD